MAGKRTNRQGFTLYHNLYENQLQYMSDEHVGKLIKAMFEYSVARCRGGKAEVPVIDCFQGFEVGALRTAITMIDTACDAYFSRSVNSKLQKLNPTKDRWDKYKEYAPKDLYKLGFNQEEVAYMKGLDPLEEPQPPLRPLDPGQGEEQEQEKERELETDLEIDPEPDHEHDHERPPTRPWLIAKLAQRGIGLSDANRMLNNDGEEAVYRRYFGG